MTDQNERAEGIERARVAAVDAETASILADAMAHVTEKAKVEDLVIDDDDKTALTEALSQLHMIKGQLETLKKEESDIKDSILPTLLTCGANTVFSEHGSVSYREGSPGRRSFTEKKIRSAAMKLQLEPEKVQALIEEAVNVGKPGTSSVAYTSPKTPKPKG